MLLPLEKSPDIYTTSAFIKFSWNSSFDGLEERGQSLQDPQKSYPSDYTYIIKITIYSCQCSISYFNVYFLANNIYQKIRSSWSNWNQHLRDEHLPAKQSRLNKKIPANSQCLLTLECKFDYLHQQQIPTHPLNVLFNQQVPVWIRSPLMATGTI